MPLLQNLRRSRLSFSAVPAAALGAFVSPFAPSEPGGVTGDTCMAVARIHVATTEIITIPPANSHRQRPCWSRTNEARNSGSMEVIARSNATSSVRRLSWVRAWFRPRHQIFFRIVAGSAGISRAAGDLVPSSEAGWSFDSVIARRKASMTLSSRLRTVGIGHTGQCCNLLEVSTGQHKHLDKTLMFDGQITEGQGRKLGAAPRYRMRA